MASMKKSGARKAVTSAKRSVRSGARKVTHAAKRAIDKTKSVAERANEKIDNAFDMPWEEDARPKEKSY